MATTVALSPGKPAWVDLLLQRGAQLAFGIQWLRGGEYADTHGATVACQIKDKAEGVILLDLTPYLRISDRGYIMCECPATVTDQLEPGEGRWDMLVRYPAAAHWRILAGDVQITERVTTP